MCTSLARRRAKNGRPSPKIVAMQLVEKAVIVKSFFTFRHTMLLKTYPSHCGL